MSFLFLFFFSLRTVPAGRFRSWCLVQKLLSKKGDMSMAAPRCVVLQNRTWSFQTRLGRARPGWETPTPSTSTPSSLRHSVIREAACILKVATERSLVIVDELGRGTQFLAFHDVSWRFGGRTVENGRQTAEDAAGMCVCVSGVWRARAIKLMQTHVYINMNVHCRVQEGVMTQAGQAGMFRQWTIESFRSYAATPDMCFVLCPLIKKKGQVHLLAVLPDQIALKSDQPAEGIQPARLTTADV